MKDSIKLGFVADKDVANPMVVKKMWKLINGIYHVETLITQENSNLARTLIEIAKLEMVHVFTFYPDWKTYPKTAKLISDSTIVDNSDILLLFWNGRSSGIHKLSEQQAKANKPYIRLQNIMSTSENQGIIEGERFIIYQLNRGSQFEFKRVLEVRQVENYFVNMDGEAVNYYNLFLVDFYNPTVDE